MNRLAAGLLVSLGVHTAITCCAVSLCTIRTCEQPMMVDLSLLSSPPPSREATPRQTVHASTTPKISRIQAPSPFVAKDAFPDSAQRDTTAFAVAIPEAKSSSDIVAIAAASVSAAPEEAAKDSAYVNANYGAIRSLIYKSMAYPDEAVQLGWQGKVQVAFLVHCDGHADEIRIVASSGYAVLDESAIDAVKRAGPYPKSPRKVEIRLPISYRFE
jgi:protein TonB